MRYWLIVVLALLLHSTLLSQQVLIPIEKLKPSENQWTFQIDSVIDARGETEITGYLFEPSWEDPKSIGLANSLQEAIQKALMTKADKSSEKLWLKINHFYVQDVMKMLQPMAALELNVSLLKPTPDGYIELFRVGSIVSHIGTPIADGIAPLLAEALENCFTDFEYFRKRNLLWNKPIDLENLKPGKNYAYNIEKAELRKGLYFHYYDFRDNRNLDTNFNFYPEYFDDDDQLSRTAKLDLLDQDIDEDAIFAFCDGRHLFINAGRRYVELLDSAGSFYFDWYPEYRSKYIGGMLTAFMQQGAREVAIHSELDYSRQAALYEIDLDIGEILPADRITRDDILAQTILYGSSFNPKNQAIEVFINGAKKCNLSRSEFYIHTSRDSSSSFELCIRYENQEVCDTIIPSIFKNDVYRCRFAHKNKLEMNKLQDENLKDFTNALKYDETKRVCLPD